MIREEIWTKCPWYVGTCEIDGKIIYWVDSDNAPLSAVADLYHCTIKDGKPFLHPKDNAEANVHLIAAAPELYKALSELLCDIKDQETWCRDSVGKAWHALAKARGEVVSL